MLDSTFVFLLYKFLVWPEQNLRYFSLCCSDSLFIMIINLNSKAAVVLRLFLIAYTPLGKYHELRKNHALIHVFPVFCQVIVSQWNLGISRRAKGLEKNASLVITLGLVISSSFQITQSEKLKISFVIPRTSLNWVSLYLVSFVLFYNFERGSSFL